MLTMWCRNSNLRIIVSESEEVVSDFQRGRTQQQTLTIDGAGVERVSSSIISHRSPWHSGKHESIVCLVHVEKVESLKHH